MNDVPPARAIGEVPFENWQDIVRVARTAPEFKLEHYTVSSPTRLLRGTTRSIRGGKPPRISRRRLRITPPMPTLSQIRRKL